MSYLIFGALFFLILWAFVVLSLWLGPGGSWWCHGGAQYERLPDIDLRVLPVKAGTRKLRAVWSIAPVDDLRAMWEPRLS